MAELVLLSTACIYLASYFIYLAAHAYFVAVKRSYVKSLDHYFTEARNVAEQSEASKRLKRSLARARLDALDHAIERASANALNGARRQWLRAVGLCVVSTTLLPLEAVWSVLNILPVSIARRKWQRNPHGEFFASADTPVAVTPESSQSASTEQPRTLKLLAVIFSQAAMNTVFEPTYYDIDEELAIEKEEGAGRAQLLGIRIRGSLALAEAALTHGFSSLFGRLSLAKSQSLNERE